MPEKTLWTRHVGMEALNSVGSTGSCDSMESISSNHSAFSGEGYDHLSAEERECLMFLEETIDSLDNEEDSGVSNDELETTEKSNSHSATEPTKVLASDGNDKTPKQIPTAFPKLEEWAYVAKIPQGYHSFPRIIQASREETTKPTTDTKLPESTSDQKSWHGKPKSLSSITKPQPGEPHISDLLIIPPPEPFRDPQVIDKRRSVTDPTDAREVRYDRALFKPATITEYKELQHVVRPHSAPAPSLFPRVSSPKTDTGSQATFSQAEEKSVEAKQGPPTAPKPRTLPPHIVIKSSSGMVSSLDPQNRPRTFSAHERIMDRTSEHTIPKVPHSKEQERARFEALHKLGLDVKSGSQENISMRSSKTDLSLTQGVGDHGYKDANRKSVGQQDEVDSMGDIPAPPSIIIHKIEEVRKESLNKNRLSIKSNSLEKDEPATGTAPQKESYVVEVPPPHHIKSSFFGISRPSIKVNTQEKADDIIIPSPKPLNEVHTTTDGPPKNIEADPTKHTSPSHSRPQTKDTKSDKPGNPDHELHTGPEVALRSPKRDVDQKPSALKTIPVEKGTVPEINPAPLKPTGEKPQEILGSVENISLMSTSPGKTFSFPRPKEVVVQHSPEVVKVRGNDKVPDKSNRHSTHFEAPNEPYLRFPQGSVPGLRQINIKSNTLERSGVGLSGSMPSLEKESQKSSSSFFKRPLFSGVFLRNNRPRPASLGTGKDFANLEPSTSEADTTEKRSFFSRPARSSAPVTSVKITPKGTSEEHRKEALKKLGILKE